MSGRTPDHLLVSMEVRWFMQGDVVPSEDLQMHDPELEVREDSYLVLPEATTVGIKLRRGSLEIKYIIEDFGLVQFSCAATGKAALWGKIGLESPISYASGNFVTLKKTRLLYCFGIVGGIVLPASFTSFPPLNFNIEFCKIDTGKNIWSSVCLAVYGKRDRLAECLMIAGRYLAEAAKDLNLTADQSLDFPQWLTLVTEQQQG